MIIVDTSVWIEHLRKGVPDLAQALDVGSVLAHPLVTGELACGNLKNRLEILGLLADLPAAVVATDPEVLTFIEQRSLMGRGIGYIDAHLLAAAVLGSAKLWTRDKRLAGVADELRLSQPHWP